MLAQTDNQQQNEKNSKKNDCPFVDLEFGRHLECRFQLFPVKPGLLLGLFLRGLVGLGLLGYFRGKIGSAFGTELGASGTWAPQYLQNIVYELNGY